MLHSRESQEIQQWVSAPESGRYNVTANVTVSRAKAEGADIRCELFYRDESISHPVFDDVIQYEGEGMLHVRFKITLRTFQVFQHCLRYYVGYKYKRLNDSLGTLIG